MVMCETMMVFALLTTNIYHIDISPDSNWTSKKNAMQKS